MRADLPANEAARLGALHGYAVLDTPPEPAFDELTQLAAQICETPAALVTLIDEKRQWFKSHHGLPISETHRDLAFCAHCILRSELMEVPDAARDSRFVDNALVTGPPNIRFYAGVPLCNPAGFALGTLAVIDYVPRTLREDQRRALRSLGRQAMTQLELRRQLLRQARQARLTGAELRRMEQRLQFAVRATNDVVWDWDLLKDSVWWNENFQTAFGYRPEQIEPGLESWTGRLHPDDLARVKDGIFKVIHGTGVRWSDEYRFRRADGGYAEIFDRGFVIRDGGKAVHMIGAMQDITDRKRATEAVRESEIRFRALMEGGVDVVVVIGTDGKIRYANPAIKAMGGYEPEEVVGTSMREYMHPADFQAATSMLTSLSKELGAVRRAVWRLRHRDGSWRVFESVSRNLLGTPAVAGFVMNLRDITDREKMATALRDALALQHAVLNSVGYSIIAVDIEGRIHTVNRAAEQLLGYQADELLGRTPAHLHDPEEIAQRAKELSEELRCPVPPDREVFLAKPRLTGQYEERQWTYIRKDGTRFPVQLAVAPLLNADRQPIGFVGIASDITERKRAETALREAEAKYRSIFDHSSEGIFQTTPEGRVISGNPALARILGYASPEELIRERTDLDHQGYTDPTLRGKFKRTIEQHGVVNGFEYESRRKDGTRIWLSENTRLVRDAAGQIICYEGSVQDITARKQAEQALLEANIGLERKVAERTAELQAAKERAEAADRLKSQFLANMSHELRTPLNAIIGFTGTLLMKLPGALNAQQEEQLTIVQTSARHLLSLINDLLDLAKIEAGKMELQLESVDCRVLLEDIVATLRPLAEHKGLVLALNVPPGKLRARTDARALKQILLNLGNNAIKFTEAGSVTLELKPPDQNGELEISVADTGIGIRPEDQGKLFRVFSQMDSTHREGTGLGLHLSQKLAQLINGKIRFTSDYGHGSRFWLTLPLDEGHHGPHPGH